LFATTALSAALLPGLAHAQLAANATPTGGMVTAGSASIAQAPADTTVTQTSQRAAIDWQSFNVGSQAQVSFKQPNSAAIALNRVTGGDLSRIDGKITANGQIVLINQSGVVFAKGSQVNAESVVVSTSNITDKNFMAGNMAFTGAPNPGAKIVNDGSITAGQAGLVGLVAPQVANAGVITARLGTVTLAGATAFTLDLYGDRLISLDVTRAVRAVDVGGKTLPALVTNSGLILADGGHITLTAQDADALVTQLIDAGGILRADSVGATAGAIAVQGIGGNISIAGNLLARGGSANTKGGTIDAFATGTVAVGAGAVIDASGQSGGGVVAIGTDLARAVQGPADKTAPAAADVTVSSGATIHADATAKGQGGTITLLSQDNTAYLGDISVRGGGQGGNGGAVEISSRGVIDLGGTVLATAPDGQAGQILLDPATLVVTSSGSGAVSGHSPYTFGSTVGSGTSDLKPSVFAALSGTIILEAASLISVASEIDMPNADELSLVSLGSIDIEAGITLSAAGAVLDVNAATGITIGAALSAATIGLISGAPGIGINGAVDAALLDMESAGTIVEGAGGALNVTTLATTGTGIAGDATVTLTNHIGTLAGFTLAGGKDLALSDSDKLTIAGVLTTTGAATLAAAGLTEVTGGAIDIGTLTTGAGAIAGNAILTLTNEVGTLDAFTVSGGGLSLNDSGLLNIAGLLTVTGAAALSATGGITEVTDGAIDVADLTGTAGADVILDDTKSTYTNNKIGVLGGYTVTNGDFGLGDDVNLAVNAGVSANNIIIAAPALTVDGTLTAGANDQIALATDALVITSVTGSLDASEIALAPLADTIVDLGTSVIGHLDLLNSLLGALTPGTLVIGAVGGGFAADDVTIGGAITPLTASALTITAADHIAVNAAVTETGQPIALNAGTGSIDIGGVITGAQLALASGAGVTETTGGAIDVDTLTTGAGGIGGAADLGESGNNIGTLGAFTATGAITLDDQRANTITGAVSTAAGITLSGVSETETSTGLLTATSLTTGTGSFTGAVALDEANHLGALGAFSATGALDLANGVSLDIVGDVTAADVTLTAPTLSLDAGLTAGSAGTLALVADTIASSDATTLVAPSGTVAIAPDTLFVIDLGGSSGTALDLAQTLFGKIDATVSEILISAPGSAAGGGITLDGSISIASDTLALSTGDAITDDGTLTANTLAFESDGFTQGTTAKITATVLQGDAAPITGDDLLTGTLNNIGTLRNITLSSGDFSLADTVALTVAGALSGPDFSLTATALALTGDITLTPATGTLALATTAHGVSQATTASITGGTLIGTSAGAVMLDGGNALTAIGDLAAAGDITINDTAALAIDGALSAGTHELILVDAGNTISEGSTGAVTAGTLATGTGSVGALLLNEANGVGTLAVFSATGALVLDDGALDITGPVHVAILQLDGTGAVTEAAAGTISATTITTGAGSVTGAVTLTGSHNAISDYGAFSATGAIEIDNTTAASVIGKIDTADALTLTGTSLSEDGGVLDVGTLIGGASFSGAVDLSGGNAVKALAGFDAGGSFNLNNTVALDLTGALTASRVTLTATALTLGAGITAGTDGILALAANAITGTGTLLAPSGTIEIAPENGGDLDVDGTATNALDLAASLFAQFDSTATEILLGKAGTFTAADINFAGTASLATPLLVLSTAGTVGDDGALTVGAAGAGTLEFEGAGFAQTGSGAISAGLLESEGDPIGGAVELTLTANTIGTLGLINTGTHDLAVTDAASLTAAGKLTAQDITLADAGTLDLTGTLTGTDGVNLIAAELTFGNGANILAPTVALAPYTSATTIDLGGSAVGDLDIGGSLIGAIGTATTLLQIGTAGSFAGGAITAENSLAIDIATVALTGTAIDFGGTLQLGADELSLASSGTVSESSGGAVVAGLLIGTATGAISLLAGTNSITSLGNFLDLAGIGLNDQTNLTISGTVDTDVLTLQEPTGNVTEAGLVEAGTLTTGGASIAGNLLLTNANAIDLLNNLDVLGTLIVDNGTGGPLPVVPMTLGGVSAGSASFSADGIVIDGLVDARDLDLTSFGHTFSPSDTIGISETGAGLIDATTLTGTDSGGDVLLDNFLGNNTNNIATLANFSVAAAHRLILDDGEILTIAGTDTAPVATLSATGIIFAGLFTAATSLALTSTGTITETTGGLIDTALLTGFGGDVFLTNANSIVLLKDVTIANAASPASSGTLDVADAAFLSLGGTLAFSSGSIAAAGIDVAGIINAGTAAPHTGRLTLANTSTLSVLEISDAGTINAGSLALASADAVSEASAGVIDAATLTSDGGTIAGTVELAGTLNAIGTLGNFAGAGDMLVHDSGSLDVTGTVFTPDTLTLTGTSLGETGGVLSAAILTTGAGSFSGSVSLGGANAIATLTAFALRGALLLNDTPELTIAGQLTTSGGVSLADAANGITETSLGKIDAVSLDSGGTEIGGDVDLMGANMIATLSGFTVKPDFLFDFTDDAALTVAGPLSADTAALTAPSLSITGAIDAGGLTLDATTGGIGETGTIDVDRLTGSAANTVLLTGANRIPVLAGFSVTGGGFTLDDGGALTVADTLAAPDAALSAGAITITGLIDVADALSLGAQNAILEQGGVIAAGTLSGSGGEVSLLSENTIDTITSLLGSQAIALRDQNNLAITGSVATPGTITLQDSGTVTESGGSIDAAAFSTGGTTDGALLLTGANQINTLSDVTVGTSLDLTNASDLIVAGPLAAAAAEVTLDAPDITFTGAVDAATLALVSPGSITQTSGAIITGTLTSGGAADGDVTLLDANSIASLGAFTLAGDLLLNDDQPTLTVAGPVLATGAASVIDITASGLLQQAGAITAPVVSLTAGTMDIDGVITAPTSLGLGGGPITEAAAGLIDTGLLVSLGSAGIGGDVTLGSANSITALGGFTLAPGFALDLTDGIALTVAGTLSADTATLTAPGLAVSGAIAAGNLALFATTGGIGETGSIDAGTLTGSAAGAMLLTGINSIAVLAGVSVGSGGFLLNDTGALLVEDSLRADNISLSASLISVPGAIDGDNITLDTATDIAVAGALTGGDVSLTVGGTLAETGGMIAAGTLSGAAALVSLFGDNRIGTIGNLLGSLAIGLTDVENLAVAGVVSTGGGFTLEDADNVNETGGVIDAAAFSTGGTTDGTLILTDAGNQIVTLDGVAAASGFALTDSTPLTLAGNVTASPLTLVDTDAITQVGGVIDTGNLTVTAPDVTLDDTNTIALLAYASASGNIDIKGAAEIGRLIAGNASFTGASLVFAGAADVRGDLHLTLADKVTQTRDSGLVKAGTLSGTAGTLADFLAADFGTIGSFIMHDSAFDLVNDGPLALLGPLVANVVSITVDGGALTLEGSPDGGLFIAGKIDPPLTFNPQTGDSVFTVDARAGGPALLETGEFFINNGPDQNSYLRAASPDATLFVTTDNGNVDLAQAPGGLIGPAINLVLSAGSGTASGNVNLFRIVVLSATSTQFSGFLDGLSGQAAAGKGIVDPFPKPPIQFNACPIQSVNCTILPIESLPAGDPLENFDISQRKHRKLNNSVQLPGVATRDF
jgi:filamentous hemagglutinin family protein